MIAGLILFVATIIFLRLVLPPPDADSSFFSNLTCPPHQWNWQEVKDKDGVTIAHRIVCAKCGPLKKQEINRDEYE